MTTAVRLKPKPRQVIVNMPYPGMVISVNHYTGRRGDGGYYVKAEARAWMEELGWRIKTFHIEDWDLPLHVTCGGQFIDLNHAPDLSNLSKCTLDAIEECTGVNDRDMRWHDGERVIKAGEEPKLMITIQEARRE